MIERLYIQNYRCLESFTIDFGGRPSALLIGKNGSGKSTVLECIKLFQQICRGSNRVGTLIAASDFSQHQTNRPMRFEIDVVLTGKQYKYAVSFDLPTNYREARILDESLAVDGRGVFDRKEGQIHLTSGGSGASFGLDWHVFALPVINERPPFRTIQDLKAFFASMILVSPVPANMTGFSEEPSDELNYDAANYASCLRDLLSKKPKAYNDFEKYVKTVIPDFSSVENVERGETGTQLIVKFEQQNPPRGLAVEFKALSDGEKCFFLSAYVIASNAASSPVFCMWDEPDNHLSLSEVGRFIVALRRMPNKGGQLIATTHHPETLRRFSDDTTFVLTRKSHLDPTLPKLLTEFSYDGDLVNALIRDEIIG